MTDKFTHGTAPQPKTEISSELLNALRLRPPPVPIESLAALFSVACADTGQSQAVRYFLFWIANIDDPTGFKGEGVLELRRVDTTLRKAALEVLSWWCGPTQSDEPVYRILKELEGRFEK